MAVAACFRAKLAGQPIPAGERTGRVLAGYRRTAADRGRGQARPFGVSDLAALLATCHRPRRRGHGVESEEVALERSFLGFELRQGGRRRLPEASVRRFRNRLRGLRDRWRSGTVTRGEVEQRVRAWVAHAAHADTWRLRRAIFRDGWFAPRGRPAPGRRVLRGGSWNNNAENQRRPGARNRNRAGNRNDNNGFRVSSTPRRRSRCGHGRGGRARERPGPVMMSRRRRMRAAASRPAPVLARLGDGRRPPRLAGDRPVDPRHAVRARSRSERGRPARGKSTTRRRWSVAFVTTREPALREP